ncbi:division plane positioning ATPase MipZ [Varunaivibrio sulfuroxidans]|uniref:Chromosome partitioning protein n=1 Tax=Varunaivibrio sulfuroxidans TaxID=1773489 RepID=A0A4R3J9L0_9PROT|nr:division plane positioning ATPase MipZ [Varunaivibrio sulfuroxidans]TCS61270.1 chromosome partitioning protein [Varunaivibrio sulfuroxidans]WES31110.1 division plane positioning ATPase MipZ [Varunaivibrio sulfuroxidans]
MGRHAHIIVVGNEKGGSGKSTTAMHVSVYLLQLGYSVAALDLDVRQASFSRYFLNRHNYAERHAVVLPQPTFRVLQPSPAADREVAKREEEERAQEIIDKYAGAHDIIVIDTPGSDSVLGRCGHSYADTLITPLNDSFVDLDVLAHVDSEKMTIKGPSHYAEMVWGQKMIRARRDGGSMDWIVMRNRLTSLDARNKRDMARLLHDLSQRIGFRLIDGFSERVIFRELYLKGLTLMDLPAADPEFDFTMSHVKARQEVRALVEALKIG